MTIDYTVDDILVVNQPYVNTTLARAKRAPHQIRTLYILRALTTEPVTVADIGNTAINKALAPYIRLVPVNTGHRYYRGGQGVTVFFDNDAQLNNSLEYSKAFLPDVSYARALNNSGSSIPKNTVVYQSGFDSTLQLPTIAVASAAAAATAVVFGITTETIGNGGAGSVVVNGSIVVDTSGFSTEGDTVYLSDTPGALSSVAGTVSAAIGRVICIGNPGSISLFSSVTSGANAGSGGGGSTTIPHSQAAIVVTSSRDIAVSDQNRILWIPDTVMGQVDLTIPPALADGFEFTVIADAGVDATVIPQAGTQMASNSNNLFEADGEPLISPHLLGATATSLITWKLMGTKWFVINIVGASWGVAPTITYQWFDGGMFYSDTDSIGFTDNTSLYLYAGPDPVSFAISTLDVIVGSTTVVLGGSLNVSLPFSDPSGIDITGVDPDLGLIQLATSSGGTANMSVLDSGANTLITVQVSGSVSPPPSSFSTQAIQFNAPGCLAYSDNIGSAPGSGVFVSMWVNFSTVASRNNLVIAEHSNGSNFRWRFYVNASEQLVFTVSNDGSSESFKWTTTRKLPSLCSNNTWAHIALNASTSIRIWVNGASTSGSQTGLPTAITSLTGSSGIILGGSYNFMGAASNTIMDTGSQIDDIGYDPDNSMADTNIVAIYNGGTPADASGYFTNPNAHYWTMEGATPGDTTVAPVVGSASLHCYDPAMMSGINVQALLP